MRKTRVRLACMAFQFICDVLKVKLTVEDDYHINVVVRED